MTVAVLTTTAGRHRHLSRLLSGLQTQHRSADDIVVVDMRDDPIIRRLVRPPARRIVLDGASTDGGGLPLAAARNLAASSTSCDQLVFLDVDCIPAPDLVARYDAVLSARPAAIACGPVRYLHEGWDDGLTAVHPPTAWMDEHSDAPNSRRRPGDGIEIGNDHELFWSLSFGITQKVWATLGGFDEDYVGYGGEDTDLAFRARLAGIPLAWFARGTAYHQWHPPSRHDPHRLPELIANARRFRDRFGQWPMTGWFDELQTAGLVRFDPESDLLEEVGQR